MTIDYNNNSVFDFNASPTTSSSFESSRVFNGTTCSFSQISRSDSLNSLVSLCSNVSCSSISSVAMANEETKKSLTELDDVVKCIPAIPSEDEDEDWLQFGYLLEESDNVLPIFENLNEHRQNYYHHHHHRHHHPHRPPPHDLQRVQPIFHRSYSLPSTSDFQNPNIQSKLPSTPESLLCNSSTASECSENSLSSLRVEVSSTPPSSPTPSCTSTTIPYFQPSAHQNYAEFESFEMNEAPSTYPEKPFTERDASSTLAALTFYFNPLNSAPSVTTNSSAKTSQGIEARNSSPNCLTKSLDVVVKEESTAESKVEEEKQEEKTDDEPIAKRTRRRHSQMSEDAKTVTSLNASASKYSPYRVTARPWWLSKLLSMRRQNSKRTKRCRKTTGKSDCCSKTSTSVSSRARRAIKRQAVKKEGANTNAESFSLCDPRYISLGGNTVPLEEMPMRMELDLSGNAKITTNSDLMQNASTAAAAAAHEENDESDEDDEDRAARKVAMGNAKDGNGNDESENDDSTNDDDRSDSVNMSACDEDGVPLMKEGSKASHKPRMAKFASLSKTGVKKEVLGTSRLETKREMAKREAQKRKAQKREEKLMKKRNVSQQRRRDRERRVHMIQMRKMMKNAPLNPISSDDNGADDEHDPMSLKPHSRMARVGAATPVVKKANVVSAAAAALKRKTAAAQKSDASADGKDSGPAKYCPCGGSYDAKKFYVCCDACSRWHHGKCAGVTEKRAAKLAEDAKRGASGWTCADCEKARTQSSAEVYCVCRRPYDDAKFYVGCDSCEDWFHPECIGTTQAEVSKLDTFLCPKCRESEDI